MISQILAVHLYTSKCLEINKIPDIHVINIDAAVQMMSSMERSKDIMRRFPLLFWTITTITFSCFCNVSIYGHPVLPE